MSLEQWVEDTDERLEALERASDHRLERRLLGLSGGTLWLIALVVLIVLNLKQGHALAAVAFAVLAGLHLGRALTMAYRRGTILRLERELAGYREWSEEDEG